MYISVVCFFFFKQKTAYEMRISDWSSDVCSSDLKAAGLSADHHRHAAILQGLEELRDQRIAEHEARAPRMADAVCQVARDQPQAKIGRASCRERVCQYV